MSASQRRIVLVYADGNGNEPVTSWLRKLNDHNIRTRIIRRINRVTQGNFGDHRHIVNGDGVCELRLNFGPGYRIYYAQDGPSIVLLLCVGTKHSQPNDIKKAINYWRDYKARKGYV